MFDGKIRVAFSVTEAIMRLNAKGIKITIPHIDAVGIVFIINISVVVAEALGGWIVGICFGPSIGKLSGRNLFSRKHICHAQAAGISQLTGEQNRIETCRLFEGCSIDDSADVQKYDGFLIMSTQEFQRFYFAVI